MNFEPLFESGKRLSIASYKKAALSVIERFNEVMQDNKDSINNTKMILQTFIKSSGQSVTRNYFYTAKQVLIEIYDYLVDIGIASEGALQFVNGLMYEDVVDSIEIDSAYFRNINEVINYINTVGRFYGFDSDKDLLTIKSIAILAWIGRLQYPKMVKITRQDFNVQDLTINCNGKIINFSSYPKLFNILLNRMDMITSYGFPSHKVTVWPSSDYLFKASKGNKHVMSQANMGDTVRRFNTEAIQYGKIINITSLSKCSVFYEMQELEKLYPKASLLTILHKIDSRYNTTNKCEAGGIITLYKKWKEML